MVNSKKKAMTTAKPSKTHKNSQAGPHIHKRKLVEEEGEDEDSDSSNSQTEPPSKSHKKYARGSRDDDLAMVHDVMMLNLNMCQTMMRYQPHCHIATPKLTNSLKDDGLEAHHYIPSEIELETKKDKAKDLHLIFTEIVSVNFTQTDGTGSLVKGHWCLPCRLALNGLGRKQKNSPNSQEIMWHSSQSMASEKHSIWAVTHPVVPISVNTSNSTRSVAKKRTYLNITGKYHIPSGIRWRRQGKVSSHQNKDPWT